MLLISITIRFVNTELTVLSDKQRKRLKMLTVDSSKARCAQRMGAGTWCNTSAALLYLRKVKLHLRHEGVACNLHEIDDHEAGFHAGLAAHREAGGRRE